ncbi:MAG: ABC transporter ATP-binding protein [Marinilabiliaceae bacterium]|jgi:iron complex transport system ATP-binding protein|nr:ABC transporter ATP-binding protein [Marinilabiliaceae bacterium]
MNGLSEILKIENLELGYMGSDYAEVLVSGINARAIEGEMIALLGANGTGKSTLLRTILGIHPCSKGNVFLRNKAVSAYRPSELSRFIGFVGTSSSFPGNLSVRELVSLGRFPYTNWIGKMKKSDYDVVNRSIENVGLGRLSEKKLDEMSDGERQRANIARVLAQDSDILLLDEPTAFLDLPNRYELIYLLKNIISIEKKTVIYSTHDLNIAIGESDKIWLLNQGRLFDGAPEDLMLNGNFSNQFTNTRIKFDNASGSYIYPKESKIRVSVYGRGEVLDLTRRALSRISIIADTEDQGESVCKILVSDADSQHKWTLVHQNTEHIFFSIYDLIYFLKTGLFSA